MIIIQYGQKENHKKDGGPVKVSRAFKIFTVVSILTGFMLVILGLIIYGSDYVAAAELYAIALFLIMLLVGWFLRRLWMPLI